MFLEDITNLKFGRLTALNFSHTKNKFTYWLCKCVCGNIKSIRTSHLKNGNTKSCSCLRKKVTKSLNITHGMSKTSTYLTWDNMKRRCYNSSNDNYPRYGGRGITVCKRWRKFENFLADMGEKPKDKSIDRIDNNGNYEPSNCKWSTPREQSNNTRRNVFITYKKTTKTLIQWARFLGIKDYVLQRRIKQGWTIERAFNQPVRMGRVNTELMRIYPEG